MNSQSSKSQPYTPTSLAKKMDSRHDKAVNSSLKIVVIDCLASSSTLSIVTAPELCKYVALSYVWGGAHSTSTEVAAVVKDAIKVTVKLSIRFLWVDKYCIPQNDSEKHRLIKCMNEIYAQAYVTIIAAAGKTAADGLPGISTVPPAFMDGRDLVSIYFATKEGDYDALPFRIVEYTRRHLSYPQDSLDAFLGVFAEYERQEAAMVSRCPKVPSILNSTAHSISLPSHIWGLPLRQRVLNLDWYHPEPPKRRRPEFPTWTWSGWEGGIELWDSFVPSLQDSLLSKHTPISFKIPDNLTGSCDQKTKHLYVTGPLKKLNLVRKNQPPKNGEFPNLDLKTWHNHVMSEEWAPGIFVIIRSTLDIEPEDEEQTFGLLSTKDFGSSEEEFFIQSIIVLRKGDQSFTRIGCIRLEDLCERRFVNIKGTPIVVGMWPSNTGDEPFFHQKFTRQRICLE
ncbi:hypothetical protein BOTCAL_0018g00350 [Botryotinia calthae]|uniref:Heterokaryon incompatibility domain-containing protein n=1 Tax=Botryotinia calthae TaxID=38488 RepID=A0A4Y8DFH4_9HELO|nr:hypothetical protein BOTCAL_0018g00350 [Botryotinia calthae]